MDFNKLRTFIKVVDEGGIRQAALQLFRTQQAISLQIKLLEEELNASLFERVGPKLHLTPEGERLYQESRKHYADLEALCRSVKTGTVLDNNIIMLGLWPEQSMTYLPYLVTKFRAMRPEVKLNITLGNDAELEELLSNNKLDFAFMLYLQNPKLFCTHTVLVRDLIPVASPRYLSRSKPINSIEDTLSHELVDYSGKYSAYQIWVKHNAPELLPLAREKQAVVTVDNDLVQKELVLKDNGIAFLPTEIIEKEMVAGNMIEILANEADPVVVKIEVAYKRKRAMSSEQTKFLELITDKDNLWTNRKSVSSPSVTLNRRYLPNVG